MAEAIIILLLLGLLLSLVVLQYQIYKKTSAPTSTKLMPPLADLAISAAHQSMWDWERSQGLFKIGPSLVRQLGYGEDALNGAESKWMGLLHPEDRQICLAGFENLTRYKNNPFRMEFRLRHAEGNYLWVELNATMLGDRCVGLVGDITSRKRAQEALLQATIYDKLTKLPNRALLLDRLEGLLLNAKQDVYLVLLDITGFRALNEQLGMIAGDNLLLMITERLKAHKPAHAQLARVGADEFALLCAAPTPQAMEMWLDQLSTALSEPFFIKKHELKLRFALGWASSADASSAETLMEVAGIAMQQSRLEKKRTRFSTKMKNLDTRQFALETDLHKALEKKEIEIHYQPIMQLLDTKVWGFEALMRWRHPRFGLISPSQFIPLAEELGLMRELGLFALQESAQHLAHWQLTYNYQPPLFVSVNVSRLELFRKELVEDVRQVIAKNFLKRGQLKLEITESLLIEHTESVGQLLGQLRDIGVEIAIDDFGTGYSSLGLLQHLPFDIIKLDRTLIGENFLTKDEKTNAIIEAIVAMARTMKVRVVAEGTDSSEKAFWLQETGCDYAQGFFYAHPMEASKVLSFLPRNRPR